MLSFLDARVKPGHDAERDDQALNLAPMGSSPAMTERPSYGSGVGIRPSVTGAKAADEALARFVVETGLAEAKTLSSAHHRLNRRRERGIPRRGEVVADDVVVASEGLTGGCAVGGRAERGGGDKGDERKSHVRFTPRGFRLQLTIRHYV